MNAAIGWVVVFCLVFSLIESKLILPSHLSLMKSSHGKKNSFSNTIDRGLKHFIQNFYSPFLSLCIQFRYATLAFLWG